MRSIFENVKFGRNTGFSQRNVESHAVFGRHDGVGGRAEEKCWRSLPRNVHFTREFLDEFGLGIFAKQVFARELVRIFGGERNHRIGENREIGSATCAVNGVG